MRPSRKPCRKAGNMRLTIRRITKKANPKAPITEPSIVMNIMCMFVFLIPDGLRGFLKAFIASSVAWIVEVAQNGASLVPLRSYSNSHLTERPFLMKTELNHKSIDNRRVAPRTRKSAKGRLRSVAHIPQLSFVMKIKIVFGFFLPERLRDSIMRSLMKSDDSFSHLYRTLKPMQRQILSATILNHLPQEKNTKVRSKLIRMASALRGCFWEGKWDSIVASLHRGLQNRIFSVGWQRGAVMELLKLLWFKRVRTDSLLDTLENQRLILNYMMHMIEESLTTETPLTEFETIHMLDYGGNLSNDGNIDIFIDNNFAIPYFIDLFLNSQDSGIKSALCQILIFTFYPSTGRTWLLIRYWTRLEDIFLNVTPYWLMHIAEDSTLISRCVQSPSLVDRVEKEITKKPGQNYCRDARFLSEIACGMLRDANFEQRQHMLGRGYLRSVKYLAHSDSNMDAAPVYRSVISQFPAWTRKFKKMTEGGLHQNPIVSYAASLPASPNRRRQEYCLDWEEQSI